VPHFCHKKAQSLLQAPSQYTYLTLWEGLLSGNELKAAVAYKAASSCSNPALTYKPVKCSVLELLLVAMAFQFLIQSGSLKLVSVKNFMRFSYKRLMKPG